MKTSKKLIIMASIWFEAAKDYAEFVWSDRNDTYSYGAIYDDNGRPVEWSEMKWRSRGLDMLVDIIKMATTLAVCTHKGHAWVDDSYGGPEGGCIDMTCSRCGYNVHETLY